MTTVAERCPVRDDGAMVHRTRPLVHVDDRGRSTHVGMTCPCGTLRTTTGRPSSRYVDATTGRPSTWTSGRWSATSSVVRVNRADAARSRASA